MSTLGKLQENDLEIAICLVRELGLPDNALRGKDSVVLTRIWDRFREYLLGHSSKRQDLDMISVGEMLELADKPLELQWSQRLMLRVRFATKGVAVGSETFVADILNSQRDILGYRREHIPIKSRAWDQVYCLKKHRVWAG